MRKNIFSINIILLHHITISEHPVSTSGSINPLRYQSIKNYRLIFFQILPCKNYLLQFVIHAVTQPIHIFDKKFQRQLWSQEYTLGSWSCLIYQKMIYYFSRHATWYFLRKNCNFCGERLKMSAMTRILLKLKFNQLSQTIIDHALHDCHNG